MPYNKVFCANNNRHDCSRTRENIHRMLYVEDQSIYDDFRIVLMDVRRGCMVVDY